MSDLLRISIFGQMPNGEEWSINPVWGLQDFGTSLTPAQVQTIATAVAAVSLGTGVRTGWSPSTTLTGCRVEARNRTGELQTQAEALKGSAEVGTGTMFHPYQTALVISLRTAQVGASGRGRLYVPATGITVQNGNLRPSTVVTDGFLTAMKTYLSGIQTAVRATTTGAYLAVWSRTQNGLFGVSQLQAGDVLDVQRRRRDVLIENYSTQAFP